VLIKLIFHKIFDNSSEPKLAGTYSKALLETIEGLIEKIRNADASNLGIENVLGFNVPYSKFTKL
jgi:hypothetical protein